MSLTVGMRLGPYEIAGRLGAGGMGEVYRARDTRLERMAAIKVLPADVAGRPELRERMQREARAISSLSHPNICALYDVGSQDGIEYLVMELLEGETLADRLKKGRLPLATALGYAIEVAAALEQAHRQGIVHRDLKPGNIMLTKSGTKLLDFGLAKVREAPKAASVDAATELLTRQLTTEGTIVGTFQYMAPEQLEGREADARSDLFAFGAVLYEMTAGRPAFAGTSQATLIAAILTEEPAALSEGDEAPAAMDLVVKACLAKDPEERWQSAADLRRELKWIATEGGRGPGTGGQGPARGRRWIAVAAASAAIAAGIAWMHFTEHTSVPRAVRFRIGGEARLASQARVSPDGSKVAFVGQNAHGANVLWVRGLDESGAHELTGTEGARLPFWSPDSRSIAYFNPLLAKLQRIEAEGGPVRTVTDTASFGAGADWGPDGTILFAPRSLTWGSVLRVPANGGTPVVAAEPEKGRELAEPRFLPDGKHFLYVEKAGLFSGKDADGSLWMASLDGKEKRKLMSTSFTAEFAPAGGPKGKPHLLYVRDGVLMAQEADARTLELKGEPVRLCEAVALDGAYGYADYSVSRDGTLAYNDTVHQHEVMWVDRTGKRIGAATPAERYAHPALSPDGKRAVLELLDGKTGLPNLWMLDLERGDLSAFEVNGTLARFTPDGQAVVWTCPQGGKWEVCRKPTGGAAPVEGLADVGAGTVV